MADTMKDGNLKADDHSIEDIDQNNQAYERKENANSLLSRKMSASLITHEDQQVSEVMIVYFLFSAK